MPIERFTCALKGTPSGDQVSTRLLALSGHCPGLGGYRFSCARGSGIRVRSGPGPGQGPSGSGSGSRSPCMSLLWYQARLTSMKRGRSGMRPTTRRGDHSIPPTWLQTSSPLLPGHSRTSAQLGQIRHLNFADESGVNFFWVWCQFLSIPADEPLASCVFSRAVQVRA